MVAERKYRAVICPVCSKRYSAGTIVEEDFGYEHSIVGGQRYVCPDGHVVFVFIQFDRRV
jgi:hypothetical protein